MNNLFCGWVVVVVVVVVAVAVVCVCGGGSQQELTVASGTDPKALAGAIAGKVRAGAPVVTRAIGPKAVFEMLRAVGVRPPLSLTPGIYYLACPVTSTGGTVLVPQVARSYLEDDGEGQDLTCFPDFEEVQLPGRSDTTNALRLVIVLTDA